VGFNDFYFGKRYTMGTHQIKNISITDRVPLFLRAGYAVFQQDVTNVRQTNDLDNRFHLVASFFKE